MSELLDAGRTGFTDPMRPSFLRVHPVSHVAVEYDLMPGESVAGCAAGLLELFRGGMG